jgi:hypothetical protein
VTNFNAAAAKALFEALRSYSEQLGVFQATSTHEVLNAPGNRLFCTINLGSVVPVTSSGLSSVSGKITFHVRVWSSAMQRPLDNIDPEVLAAASSLMGAFSGGFTLGGTVREIDLFSLSAQAAYTEFEGKQFRVVEITVGVIVNDMWSEAS